MEEATACVKLLFLVAITIGSMLPYWLTYILEKQQNKIEDALLARQITRKLYESFKKEKNL